MTTCLYHPHQVGESRGSGITRSVFVGAYGKSHSRYCYLSRVNGRFYIAQEYGAGSSAGGSMDAASAVAWWRERGVCLDICDAVDAAIAAWPTA